MKLWAKILIAIGLGVVTGILFGPQTECLKPIGTLFINSLNMLVVPLVFSSMITGITSMPDSKKLGRVGGVTLLLYFVTTLMAIALGLCLSSTLELGKELHFALPASQVVKPLPTFSDMLVTLVPKNPIQAFAEGNVLQIILFAVLMGVSLNLIGEKGKPLLNIFESLSQAMLKLTSLIMSLSPIGVFAIMAWASGTFGVEMLVPVLKFLAVYWAASLLFAVVVFSALLFMVKLSPLPFFKGMTEAVATAASTCSSSATLASNIHCSTKNLGISAPMANFVLPLGCSLNMNGSALFQAMSALFVAQAYGIDLTLQHMLVLSATVILATIGTASIPGAGLLMLSIVFSSVGIPLEGIAILAGIDRLRDMAT
ncbi:MAG TPA: dicarboxylate/amino acid:cation symporter, partial [Chlamydiales bacterium]|nr:dicarboxylate/amino acid:cation symporter [Chlamydiales bacterium]